MSHEFEWGPLLRDDSHEAGCSCGDRYGRFDFQEDAEAVWRAHVQETNE